MSTFTPKWYRYPWKQSAAYGTRLENLALVYLLVTNSLRNFFIGQVEQVVGQNSGEYSL